MNKLVLDETFSKKDYSQQKLRVEYDNCTFVDCAFKEADLSTSSFLECRFIDCDFSNAQVKTSSFKEVDFEGCKMIGVNFSECNPFMLALKFTNCNLNFASFFKLPLKGTHFVESNLKEADFIEAKLAETIFSSCDLAGARFKIWLPKEKKIRA